MVYARNRWPTAFDGRCGEGDAGRAGGWPTGLVTAGCALAGLVGVLNLAWASGISAGLADLSGRQTAVDRAALGVYGVLALAAAVGPLMLMRPRPLRAPLSLALALTWAGTASMFAWGHYFLATTAAGATLSTPALSVVTTAKALAALLVAAGVLLLRGRFQPASQPSPPMP